MGPRTHKYHKLCKLTAPEFVEIPRQDLAALHFRFRVLSRAAASHLPACAACPMGGDGEMCQCRVRIVSAQRHACSR